ncbi:hypothetical protein P43SY_000996 [Pythium insidiosum]|uniref:N-acetyltransferase domain-containing protein n=1 Tax=Pythium insidiosum TaxID=114742 RepID=A0AAD5LK95_PYTIN|nr:hypothetical protein P43SY_000996 [Pythium insidiosum]
MARTPTIREAEADDVPAIAAVVKSTGILPTEVVEPLFARYVEEKAAQVEARPICLVLVDDSNAPLAVAYFAYESPTNMTWNLLLLAVHKAHHGRGLGKQILSAVEYVLKTEAAARMLIIETSSTREFDGTRAFYEKRGYTEAARIADFYDDGNAKVVYQKRLQGKWPSGESCVIS